MIQISGGAAKDYTVSSRPKDSLAPGATAKFNVSFKTKSNGLRAAQLKISSNDANENPFIIRLAGRPIGATRSLRGEE
jgi:hypothetical protein